MSTSKKFALLLYGEMRTYKKSVNLLKKIY